MNIDSFYQSIFWGRPSKNPQKIGETPTPKNRDFRDIKLQIFGSEGVEKFENFWLFLEKLPIFELSKENLAKIWLI